MPSIYFVFLLAVLTLCRASAGASTTIEWDPVAEAWKYEIQVESSDRRLISAVLPGKEHSWTIDLTEGPYKYRVRAYGASGRPGEWTTTGKFSVGASSETESGVQASFASRVFVIDRTATDLVSKAGAHLNSRPSFGAEITAGKALPGGITCSGFLDAGAISSAPLAGLSSSSETLLGAGARADYRPSRLPHLSFGVLAGFRQFSILRSDSAASYVLERVGTGEAGARVEFQFWKRGNIGLSAQAQGSFLFPANVNGFLFDHGWHYGVKALAQFGWEKLSLRPALYYQGESLTSTISAQSGNALGLELGIAL